MTSRSSLNICLVALLVAFLAISVYGQVDPVDEFVDAAAMSTQSDDDVSTFQDTDIRPEQPRDDMEDLEQSLLISLLMIIVSEIGDKTFLIACIMAMKHSRLVVFAAAFSSLAIMSILSAFLGHVVPNLIPKTYTDVIAALLFFCFGLRMLWEGWHMDKNEGQEEMSEVEQELKQVEERDHMHKLEALEVGGMESGEMRRVSKAEKAKEGLMNLMQLVFSPVFVQTFVLTFLGEWGDRSQISTIALAAANNVYWVTAGVIVGHTMCTALAVIGGRMLAAKISVRTVTLVGAVLFLIFGVYYSFHAYHGQLA